LLYLSCIAKTAIYKLGIYLNNWSYPLSLYVDIDATDSDMNILKANELRPYTVKNMIIKIIDFTFIFVNCYPIYTFFTFLFKFAFYTYYYKC
jgi:hypothetical protein